MWDWMLIIVGLLTALYWYLTYHHSYWRLHGVYTLPGALPGVGHMWDVLMFKKGSSWTQCEMYHQTKGHPAVGIYSFRMPALLVRDPDLIQTVLIKEFSSFHDNPIDIDEKVDPYTSKNPFVLKGQRWRTLRQQLTPAFSPGRVKAMFPLIQRVCHDFNNYMEKRLNTDVNVNHLMGLFTSEIVAKCAFGLDGNAFINPNAEFYQYGRKMWDSSINNPFVLFFFTYIPFVNRILKRGFFPNDVLAFFLTLVNQAADYRERNPDKVPDNDYLQFLLNLKNKNEFTLDDVFAQSLTFFTDGFETSSITASFALYELAMQPEIQEAVRQEVHSMESFNYENMTALPLLDRVVQETLRKYSIFVLTRECTKDFTLEAGGQSYPVRKGQHVSVPVYAIHHDPEIYPDPDKFDPDRFLPETIKSRHPVSFMGFGAGPRICIGNRFATCQVKVLISNVLANFRLIKCSKTEEKITHNSLLTNPIAEKGIWLQFQKL